MRCLHISKTATMPAAAHSARLRIVCACKPSCFSVAVALSRIFLLSPSPLCCRYATHVSEQGGVPQPKQHSNGGQWRAKIRLSREWGLGLFPSKPAAAIVMDVATLYRLVHRIGARARLHRTRHAALPAPQPCPCRHAVVLCCCQLHCLQASDLWPRYVGPLASLRPTCCRRPCELAQVQLPATAAVGRRKPGGGPARLDSGWHCRAAGVPAALDAATPDQPDAAGADPRRRGAACAGSAASCKRGRFGGRWQRR